MGACSVSRIYPGNGIHLLSSRSQFTILNLLLELCVGLGDLLVSIQ